MISFEVVISIYYQYKLSCSRNVSKKFRSIQDVTELDRQTSSTYLSDKNKLFSFITLHVELFYKASIFQLTNYKLVAMTTITVLDVSVVVTI
jgi:hypothetical protein